MENILLVGNGFDIAHELPTSYLTYAEYVDTFERLFHNPIIMESSGLNITAKPKYNYLDTFMFALEDQRDEFAKLLDDNIWNIFFREKYGRLKIGDYWYDLENLIKLEVNDRSSKILEDYDRAIYDFNRFRRAFEIYIYYFTELAMGNIYKYVKKLDVYRHMKDITPQYIINYNYSNTFSRFYDSMIEVDYLHGHAEARWGTDTCNIVFGINEISIDERKETCKEFTKKWQMNEAGIKPKYKEWLCNGKYNLHVYGHSLDETDKESLREILLSEAINQIYIWVLDEKDGLRKLNNISSIIGEKAEVVKEKIIFNKI